MKALTELRFYRRTRLIAYIFIVLYEFGFYGYMFPFLIMPYTGVIGGGLFGVFLYQTDPEDWGVVRMMDAIVLLTLLIWPLTFNF